MTNKKLFDRTDLGSVYKKCCNEPELQSVEFEFPLDEGYDRYTTMEQAHEAAYDAYMTGYIFAKIAKHKQAVNKVMKDNYDSDEEVKGYKKVQNPEVDAKTLSGFKDTPVDLKAIKSNQNQVRESFDGKATFYFGEDSPSAAFRDR